MAIFQRVGDLVKANINDLLDRAENPEKMVKQIIIDMEKELQQCTNALGQAMGSQRQMKKQLDKAKAESQEWENKAKLALKAGNQDLAKQALAKKVNADKQVEQYQQMYDQCTAQVDTIKGQVDALKMKLEEAKSRQSTLIARSKMADAQKSMAKTLGSMDSSSAFSKLDKMEEKIEAKEAQADAFSDLAGTANTGSDPFAELEANSAVDDELARLMAEMNGGE
ncbi:PspA/IM30 family protein [uncultured Ruminococcus sp.]|uniref:PspA/IM30 family protein n=1 Tax=uncultured Ruminococcus sp. TaxID=165186 RepID=UPI0025FE87B8|nr:PspA/IM30 family protein [uncultured Ruminococcus sp.]